MSLLKQVFSIFEKKNIIDPIRDDFIYDGVPDGYAGGSLEHSNVIIVGSEMIDVTIAEDIFARECCYVKSCTCSELSGKMKLDAIGADLIGSFNHIVNIISVNQNYDIYELYRLLQVETDYLIEKNIYATICTVIVSYPSNPIDSGIISLLKGLGSALPNHNIILNGILSYGCSELSATVEAAVYLSSKYGQIMTGEVIKMK